MPLEKLWKGVLCCLASVSWKWILWVLWSEEWGPMDRTCLSGAIGLGSGDSLPAELWYTGYSGAFRSWTLDHMVNGLFLTLTFLWDRTSQAALGPCWHSEVQLGAHGPVTSLLIHVVSANPCCFYVNGVEETFDTIESIEYLSFKHYILHHFCVFWLIITCIKKKENQIWEPT